MAVAFTRQADRDLVECLLYGLETFGKRQAESYLSELRGCFDLLERHPGIGRLREEFSFSVRTHHHGKHTIVYQADDKGSILIIAVIRDGTDMARRLRALSTDTGQ